MTPSTFLRGVIRPTLALMGEKFQGPQAEVLLLAISLQESGLEHRQQVGGPAMGLYQFERLGGVKGVLTHPSSAKLADYWARELLYTPNDASVYLAIRDNDVLATIWARLLLWTDKDPLPAVTDEARTWDYYRRNWRPGKPHPETWPANLAVARKEVL